MARNILDGLEEIIERRNSVPGFEQFLQAELLQADLQEGMPGEFTDVRHLADGGTKSLFYAMYQGQETVLKITRGNIGKERAREHVRRGYDVAHEWEMMQRVWEPGKGIPKPIAFFPSISPMRKKGIYVEEYLSGAQTLFARVVEGLTKEQFDGVFSRVIDIEDYLVNERGVLHRDLSPFNVLITPSGEVYVVDLANAALKRDIHQGAFPTRGAGFIEDPRLWGANNEQGCDEKSEVYAVGKCALLALGGNAYLVPRPGNSLRGDFSLQDTLQGNLDEYDAKLEDTFERLPEGTESYHSFLRACLAKEGDERYATMDEVRRGFLQAKIDGRIKYIRTIVLPTEKGRAIPNEKKRDRARWGGGKRDIRGLEHERDDPKRTLHEELEEISNNLFNIHCILGTGHEDDLDSRIGASSIGFMGPRDRTLLLTVDAWGRPANTGEVFSFRDIPARAYIAADEFNEEGWRGFSLDPATSLVVGINKEGPMGFKAFTTDDVERYIGQVDLEVPAGALKKGGTLVVECFTPERVGLKKGNVIFRKHYPLLLKKEPSRLALLLQRMRLQMAMQ